MSSKWFMTIGVVVMVVLVAAGVSAGAGEVSDPAVQAEGMATATPWDYGYCEGPPECPTQEPYIPKPTPTCMDTPTCPPITPLPTLTPYPTQPPFDTSTPAPQTSTPTTTPTARPTEEATLTATPTATSETSPISPLPTPTYGKAQR